MKKIISLSILFISSISVAANTGLLFNATVNKPDLTIRPNVNFYYPSAGIKITSSRFELQNQGHECTPSSSGFCLFAVSPSQPKTLSITGDGQLTYMLCTNGDAALNCQNYVADFSPTKAYISNLRGGADENGFVSICPLDSNGNITPANCTDVDRNTWQLVSGVAVWKNTLYVANLEGGNNGDGFVSYCSLSPDGRFTSDDCTDVLRDQWGNPEGLTVSNNKLYVANMFGVDFPFYGTVSICSLNPDGSFTNDCRDVSRGTWREPSDVIVSKNKLYVANQAGPGDGSFNGFVSICSLDANGNFTPENCRDVDRPEWNSPAGVTVSNNKLYIANMGGGTPETPGFVTICSLNANGNFTPDNCTDVDRAEWQSLVGVTVSNNKLYVTDIGDVETGNRGLVSICNLDTNGNFTPANCTDVNKATWNQPSDIAIK
ncbi:hypothetical protein [Legionella yabuuchiae]|uniref:hypothetical protein n=1 Tax=Legionella yabuuchiae TaxID=376727 RepID=UPI0010558685|nr:hypothetical protein [Legionella yabuuchiae]